MSKSTISTFEFLKRFPSPEAAQTYIEARRWPNGAVCPHCDGADRITPRKAGFYRCNQCKKDFTVRTGTIFERSHVSLDKWLFAMYLLLTARKGISSMQLAKELGITQKSAWFVLHRIREACGNDLDKLRGIVEIDETYFGGKETNKHAHKKLNAGRGTVGKTAILGMRERGGKTIAKPIKGTDAKTLSTEIRGSVELGATLHTDTHAGYTGLAAEYGHFTVNHSGGEYVRDGVTTNGIESVWAVFKRGMHGTYHHCENKHLPRYVNEFTFRLNEGRVARHTMQRLESLVDASFGQRLTYLGLTS